MKPGFDWPAMLRAGLGVLHLRPEEFWRLTPVELQLMLGPEPGNMSLGRADLERLEAAFPDRMNGETNDGTR
jgi:uncharacterized phage protein (TIGR02216 family)